MRTLKSRWRHVVTITSLVVYVLTFAIPVAMPTVAKAETAGVYEVWGQVLIDNRPAHLGFTVRLKNKATGQEYWPKVENGEGWYRKPGVEAGTYLVTHYSTCPGNNNFDFTVGEGSWTVPTISLRCNNPTPTPVPLPTYEVWGHVVIDNHAAQNGFAVRLKNKTTGQEYWPQVENGDGWYRKQGVFAGTYLVTHYSTCPGNNNFEYTVGEGAQTVPEIRLSCGTPTPAPVPYYEVWGHVLIDGRDGHDGFTVRLKNKATGQEYWPKVANGAGWYTSPRVDAGTYLITHYSTCPGNNNFEYTVGEGAQTVPEIRLSCAPQGSFSLSGRVYVDGQPAWSGFGVKAVKDGRVIWALADSNGYYSFQNLEAGSYSVGHVHPCATEGGNPITVNMDGNKTVDFRLKCVSEPSPPPDPDNRTCREILDELGISMSVLSSNAALEQYAEAVYLPLIALDSDMTSDPPVNQDIVVMNVETFVRLATQLDDIQHYITATVGISGTHFTFFHEKARGAGFSEDLIDLTNQMVMFQNDLLSEERASSSAVDMAGTLYDNYPLLTLYMDAATSYSNSPQAASAMDEVRGLGTETCVCGGSMMFPRPERGAERKILGYENSESEAYTTLYLHGFRETWDFVPDELVRGAGYTRRQTWHPEYCGVDTYRDEGNYYPSKEFPGKWVIWIQDYEGMSPRGEPNPEIFLHGIGNWPTVFWGAYVIQWHRKY